MTCGSPLQATSRSRAGSRRDGRDMTSSIPSLPATRPNLRKKTTNHHFVPPSARMNGGTIIGGWLLGLAIGMRHALEPDHLAAIATMVAERPRARAAALIGASWGLG